MRLFIWALLAAVCWQCVCADDSELVRSGNGFIYDIPRVSQLELELNNEFPTGDEFPQDAIPVAPSDAELGQAETEAGESDQVASADSAVYASSKGHGYAYEVPSRRFKS